MPGPDGIVAIELVALKALDSAMNPRAFVLVDEVA